MMEQNLAGFWVQPKASVLFALVAEKKGFGAWGLGFRSLGFRATVSEFGICG